MLDVTAKIDTNDPIAICNEIHNIYNSLYGIDNFEAIEEVFIDVDNLFKGEYIGYLSCDTYYHDLEHTLQATLALARIIVGYNKQKKSSPIPKMLFKLGMVAVLLHDSGYIKHAEDPNGTGAKYTLEHIDRSVEFASYYMKRNKYSISAIERVQNMIRCTGVAIDFTQINFKSINEKIVGFGLGSADFLSQMAASDYIGKLPILFNEFNEAYEFIGREKLREEGVKIYLSAEDLIRTTPLFWEFYVKKHLKEMGSVYKYLRYYFPNKRNLYMEAIERNMQKIKEMITNNEI